VTVAGEEREEESREVERLLFMSFERWRWTGPLSIRSTVNITSLAGSEPIPF
jgi:hypothetical protein